MIRALEGDYSGLEILSVDALDGIEVDHEYEIEVIGGERQGSRLSEPRVYAWVKRYDRTGRTQLDAALVRFMLVGGSAPLVDRRYPVDSLAVAIERGLPEDVEAFARMKLAELQ